MSGDAQQGQQYQAPAQLVDEGVGAGAGHVDAVKPFQTAAWGVAFRAGQGLVLGRHHVGDGPVHLGLDEVELAGVGRAGDLHAGLDRLVPLQVLPVAGVVVAGGVRGDQGLVDGIEGLVHISEISWERVENPADYVKVGDAVSAKIIAIDKDRLSLSMKQTQEDPWAKEASAFNKGDAVDGTVTRITPFGAFIQLSPSVEALVHISELGEGQGADPEKLFTLNEKKKFKVLDIDRDNRKISLSLQ